MVLSGKLIFHSQLLYIENIYFDVLKFSEFSLCDADSLMLYKVKNFICGEVNLSILDFLHSSQLFAHVALAKCK